MPFASAAAVSSDSPPLGSAGPSSCATTIFFHVHARVSFRVSFVFFVPLPLAAPCFAFMSPTMPRNSSRLILPYAEKRTVTTTNEISIQAKRRSVFMRVHVCV